MTILRMVIIDIIVIFVFISFILFNYCYYCNYEGYYNYCDYYNYQDLIAFVQIGWDQLVRGLYTSLTTQIRFCT